MKQFIILCFILIFILSGIKFYNRSIKPPAPAPIIAPEPPAALSRPPTPLLDPAQIQKVMESTKDIDPNVRWQSLKFLVKINVPQADGLVSEMLQSDQDINVRKNIVLMLGDNPGPMASENLRIALRDMEPPIRVAAILMLDKTKDYAAAPAISELLHDINDTVRLQAVTTLNSLQAKQAEDFRKKQEEELRRRQQLQQAQSRGEK